MKEVKLLPLVGFGDVRFGMTVDQVEKILGKPSEKNVDVQYGDEPDDVSTELIYDELGLSLSFDKVANYRLVDIMTEEGANCSLNGIFAVGDDFDSVIKKAIEADFGSFDETDLEDEADDEEMQRIEEEGLKEYVFEEKSLSLWFANDKLETIQIGPEYDEKDNIKWPE